MLYLYTIVNNCLLVCYAYKFVCIVGLIQKMLGLSLSAVCFLILKAKYECALKHTDSIKIVTPSWIVDSIKEKKKLDERSYEPSKAETKTEAETTSSLLTPDENDRTTATPLPGSVPRDTSVSTLLEAGSRVAITMPSALMSPVSPAVTTASEGNLSVTTVQSRSNTAAASAEEKSTVSCSNLSAITVQSRANVTAALIEEKSAVKDSNTSEKTQKAEPGQETVAADALSGVKIVENNNEAIVDPENEKENKETTNEQDPGKSSENQGWQLRMHISIIN